jgi:hypothetical protein
MSHATLSYTVPFAPCFLQAVFQKNTRGSRCQRLDSRLAVDMRQLYGDVQPCTAWPNALSLTETQTTRGMKRTCLSVLYISIELAQLCYMRSCMVSRHRVLALVANFAGDRIHIVPINAQQTKSRACLVSAAKYTRETKWDCYDNGQV